MWWIILSSVVVNFTDCKKNGRKSLKIFALRLIDRKWKNDNLLDICNLFFETEEISPKKKKKNKCSKDFQFSENLKISMDRKILSVKGKDLF